MLVIEPATAVRFSSRTFTRSRRPLSHPDSLFVSWNKVGRLSDCSCPRWNKVVKNGIRASAEGLSGPLKPNAKPLRYHPSEDISDSESDDNGEAMLKPAETSRTVIEVNSKALLMFAGLISDEIQDNLFWPELPYVTDEHGDIYFQVKNDEDVLQTLTSEDNPVHVIIGLDTSEMISEMESIRQADVDFDDEELDEDSDFDDDSSDNEDEDGDDDDDEYDDEDWVAILEDVEDEDDSDGSLGDWAKLETMRSLHPLQFARELAQFVSDDPVNYMDQPPAGVAIQGLLRPAFVEENSVINKNMFDQKPNGAEENQISKVAENTENLSIINGHRHELGPSEDSSGLEEGLQKDESLGIGTSYYKLEMMKLHLISAHGSQTLVELEDFRTAKPDAIAHSAAKIISRVKTGGEKTTLALKSLCWRSKGIQAEEVALIGVDSLGFDLRVCSGRQVQTLRFGFNKRVYSEYSAERQLNCLLFPRIHGNQQKRKEAHQTEL